MGKTTIEWVEETGNPPTHDQLYLLVLYHEGDTPPEVLVGRQVRDLLGSRVWPEVMTTYRMWLEPHAHKMGMNGKYTVAAYELRGCLHGELRATLARVYWAGGRVGRLKTTLQPPSWVAERGEDHGQDGD